MNGRKQILSKEQIKKVKKLRKLGYSIYECASSAGMAYSSAYYILKGFPMPNKKKDSRFFEHSDYYRF